jgi:undecaprenyl-diphosphatase
MPQLPLYRRTYKRLGLAGQAIRRRLNSMSIEQIIVLALIQGITEYLPISSSGHLILVPTFTGWPDQGVVTDMVTNLGTLAATMIYFWRDVVSMSWGALDVLKRRTTFNSQLLTNVVIGTIPIIVAGVLLKVTHLDQYIRSPLLVAINFIVFGLLLYAADAYGLFRHTVRDLNWKTALIIGASQMLSLSPGTSRSGVTMTAGRALGFVRPEAARFSFLLSIPANAAASIFVIGNALKTGEHLSGPVILTGLLTFFVGLGTITFLMRIVRSVSFLPFVVYRVIMGGALLGLIYSGATFGALN